MSKRRIVLISLGLVAALLIVCAVFVLLPGRTLPKLSAREKRVVITPTPGVEEISLDVATPAPTPIHIIQTPKPVLPATAVNLLADGTPLFALDSRDTAKLLLDAYFQRCAYDNIGENSFLLKASVVPALSTVPADGSVELLTYEEALQKLLKNRSLISVQRTLEHAELRFGTVESTSERTQLLPKGSRIYKRLGAPSRTIALTEILFKDGIAYKETETLEKQIFTGYARAVLEGTYVSALPDAEPDPAQGVPGKDKGSLVFYQPVRGKITSYFGMRFGQMHYGVDVTAKPGANVIAPEEGTVIFCRERAGYGFVIEIRHENGFVSRLAGCGDPVVELDEHVAAGQTVAAMPDDAGMTSAILHFEILVDGIPVNPMYYFE